MNQADHPQKTSIKSILFLCLISTAFSQASPAQAQITPDNTLGTEASQLNQNLIINGVLGDKIEGGAKRGSNLFHSFSEFNIENGQRVYFANPTGIENILTRVTGRNKSNIFGTLGVDGAANLFLINPNGILFGENARLDVQGSFVGTTANGVQFGNQGIFSATNPQAPPLLTIQPSALWFNQLNQDAAIQNNGSLQVPLGRSLALVGGNINLDGGILFTPSGKIDLGGLAEAGTVGIQPEGNIFNLNFPSQVQRADVSLSNGSNVGVTSTGGGGIAVNARNLNISGASDILAGIISGGEKGNAGNIEINTTDTITIDGTSSTTASSSIINGLLQGSGSAGDITINTGSLNVIGNAQIGSASNAKGDAGNVIILAKDKVSFSGTDSGVLSAVSPLGMGNGANINIRARSLSLTNGAQIATSTLGKGNAGNIQINADDSVFVSNGSVIQATTFGQGNAGKIFIDSGDFSLRDGAELVASTYGQGNAGNVTVGAKNTVSLAGNAYILSAVEAGGVGKGGNIDINAATLSIIDGAQLLTITRAASATQPAGRGDAGNVNVKVTGAVDIAGEKNGFRSGIRSNVGTGTVGNGGNIFIDSGLFSLRDGAQLVASTYGQGNAGNVNVKVTGAVDIVGEKNDFLSGIRSLVGTGTVGNGGNITIDSGSFSLRNDAQLEASTYGQGNAGNVTVDTKDAISLAGNAYIFSTVEAGGVGKGGNIDINATTLSLTDGAQLLTSTRSASATQPAGQGDAGNVNIKVTGAVNIAGEKNGFRSGIRSNVETGTVGNGGNIFIDSGSFSLRDGAQLEASTSGQGNAGNVTVGAKNAVSLAGNAYILSAVEAGGVGKGGNIDINAATLSIIDGAQLLTATRAASATQPAGRGDAGNVNVLITGAVDIAGEKNNFRSGIRSNVETGTVGNGGNITINSGDFSLSDGAELEASTSGQGNAGNVTVGAKNAISLANGDIFSTVQAGGVGKGGNIDINAASLSLTDSAQLLTATRKASDTQPAGRGNAGNVNVLVTDAVDIAGVKNGFSSAIFTDVGTGARGNGGNITIDSGSFSLIDGAQLEASTSGVGNAGNVTVGAKNAISLANGDIFSTVQAGGVGKGGNIDINAATLSIIDGAQLLTITRGASATQPAGRGDAGNVNVKVTGAVDIAGEKNDFPSGIRSLVGTETVGNGGNITIDSGSFSLSDGAQLNASTYGQGNAGNVTVGAKNAISLADNAYIFSTVSAGSVGNSGGINIRGSSLSLTDGAQLQSGIRGADTDLVAGQGNGGSIDINLTGALTISGTKGEFASAIFTDVETEARGNGGNINISSGSFSLSDGALLVASTGGQGLDSPNSQAGNITLNTTGKIEVAGADSAIRSTLLTGGVGNGGNIFIDSGDFSLSDGAELEASTYGQGNAGNVTVGTKNAVDLAGNAYILSTVEAGGVGKGGNIDINATTLSLTDGAQLLTITRGASATQPAGQGDAGNVNVLVTGAINIVGEKNGFPSAIFSLVDTGTVGNGGNIFIDSSDLSLSDGALLNASTFGQGNAGNIRINAKDAINVSRTNQETGLSSALFTFTDSNSQGKGGDINVNTNIFRLSDGALLDARTRNNQKGGDITVNSNVFEALNGGQLTTTTSSNGRAGKITVNATDKVIINGSDPSYSDRITNFPDNVANIGANSGLFVSSTGSGITGDIEINSPKITLDNQGKLNAESASGSGGNINANSNLLLLRRGAQISTNAGTEKLDGNGGNININSKFIVAVPKENSDISANAFTGTGGNIQINSQGIFGIESRPKLTEKSDITASSELGISGVTNINTPDNSSIQNSFTGLSPNVIDTNALIANSCISRGTKRQENSFTITGSGALRYTPGDVLTSAYTTGDVRSVEPTPRPWKKGDPIIEPQGLYRLPNGQLILSRSCSK